MDATIHDILKDLHALALRNGWTQVASTTERLRQEGTTPRLVLAFPSGVPTEAFQRWLTATCPQTEILSVSLASLLSTPYPALEADKLIAPLPCGHMLTGQEVDAIEQLFFSRPAGTYAFALTEAEEIEDAEDMDLVERGSWRLLVPEPKPDWTGQKIEEQGCYLWSDRTEIGYATTRVEADSAALSAWLQAPVADLERLRKMQTIFLLNQTRSITQQNATSSVGNPPLSSNGIGDTQLRDAHERVIELRRRWTRRLDADSTALERQLTTSLQTLELEMQRNLEPYLVAAFRRHEPRSGAELQRLLKDYISTGVQDWYGSTRTMLQQRRVEIETDTEALLKGIDWSVINQILQQRGLHQTYPQALWTNISIPTDLTILDTGSGIESEINFRGGENALRVRFAATGAVVSAVTLFLLGIGPIAIIAAGAGAALGGTLLSDKIQHGQALREGEEYGKRAIQKVMQEATRRVRQETRHRFQQVRDSIKRDLESLESILESALVESRNAPTGLTLVTGGGSLPDELDDYLHKLVLIESDGPTLKH